MSSRFVTALYQREGGTILTIALVERVTIVPRCFAIVQRLSHRLVMPDAAVYSARILNVIA